MFSELVVSIILSPSLPVTGQVYRYRRLCTKAIVVTLSINKHSMFVAWCQNYFLMMNSNKQQHIVHLLYLELSIPMYIWRGICYVLINRLVYLGVFEPFHRQRLTLHLTAVSCTTFTINVEPNAVPFLLWETESVNQVTWKTWNIDKNSSWVFVYILCNEYNGGYDLIKMRRRTCGSHRYWVMRTSDGRYQPSRMSWTVNNIAAMYYMYIVNLHLIA